MAAHEATAPDYIVVGGGTAGCVLAARLSEDPSVSVLLLEPGERDSLWSRVPAAFRRAIYRSGLTWPLTSEPEPGLGGRRTPLLAGRALGGSSAINGLVYVRGQPRDLDEWEALGAVGWGAAAARRWYETVERHWPLATVADPRLLQADFARALNEAGHVPLADPVRQPADGYFAPRVTVDTRGRRHGGAEQLRAALPRPNLRVVRGARAVRVCIERGRATGVEWLHAGARHMTRAAREIVLSAGAYHSPQLLLLSGVGPADQLAAHGLPVAVDLPGVGANLANHSLLALRFHASQPLPALQALRLDRLLASALAWALAGQGFLALQPTSQLLMLRSQPGLAQPDFQVTLGTLGNDADWWFPGIKPAAPHAFTAGITQLRPASRGWVRLASADPLTPPRVQCNLLMDDGDVAAIVRCIWKVRELFQCDGLAPWVAQEWLPGADLQGEAELERWLRQATLPSGHPVGTCRMGSDALAVVDPALRVQGVAGLRVIDASVMPTLPAAGTYASTLMIAERGAALLAGRGLVPGLA